MPQAQIKDLLHVSSHLTVDLKALHCHVSGCVALSVQQVNNGWEDKHYVYLQIGFILKY